jgi:hypothetical protein
MGIYVLVFCIFLLGYCAYEKHCETKQIEAVSKMDWLTYEQVSELIDKIK